MKAPHKKNNKISNLTEMKPNMKEAMGTDNKTLKQDIK